jgi:hypothetical protein
MSKFQLVLKRELRIEHWRIDWDNGWSYVEIRHNNRLHDNYFARNEFLFPDGSLK